MQKILFRFIIAPIVSILAVVIAGKIDTCLLAMCPPLMAWINEQTEHAKYLSMFGVMACIVFSIALMWQVGQDDISEVCYGFADLLRAISIRSIVRRYLQVAPLIYACFSLATNYLTYSNSNGLISAIVYNAQQDYVWLTVTIFISFIAFHKKSEVI